MITDRTSIDTYYNTLDLNRVEAKTREIADLLTSYGYPVTIITKTDWVKSDFPSATEMGRYLGNIQKCITQFNALPGLILPVSMSNLTYVDANNIEKILLGLDEMINIMVAAFRECGTFYCGE